LDELKKDVIKDTHEWSIFL